MKKKKADSKKLRLLESEQIKDNNLYFSETNSMFSIKSIEFCEKEVSESKGSTKKALEVIIKAIHAGRTGNEHIFLADKIKGEESEGTGIHSFTKNYCKPMLVHHDTYSDSVGRIIEAKYSEEEGGCAVIKAIVTDADAMEKVKDGRYNTVSIGARTNSVKCNICGTDILKGWCEHRRGQEYDGVVCGWELGDLWFYECSFVNVPADQKAKVLQWKEVDYDPYNSDESSESTEETEDQVSENETGETQTVEEQQEDLENGNTDETATENSNESEDGTEKGSQENTEDDAEEGTSEKSTGETSEESNEEGSEGETEKATEEENSGSPENTEEAVTPKELGNTVVELNDSVYNKINEMVEKTVKAALCKTEEIEEKLAKSYNTICASSETIELAFKSLKKIYNKLKEYTDSETEEYNESWSLQDQINAIESLFETIDSEIELQKDFSADVPHGGKKQTENHEKAVNTVEQMQGDIFNLMVRKKY